MLLMLKMSMMVFVAITQMYTDTVYCIHAPHPSKRDAKAPYGLPSCGFSSSSPSSLRRQLC